MLTFFCNHKFSEYKDININNTENKNNKSIMGIQINDLLKDGINNVINQYYTNIKQIFNRILTNKIFIEIKDYNYESEEKATYSNLNDQIFDLDFDILYNELNFVSNTRSLSEDLEARLINILTSLQSKKYKHDNLLEQLKEIVVITKAIKTKYKKNKTNKNEFLDKVF